MDSFWYFFGIVGILILAMYIRYKTNEKKEKARQIREWKERRLNLRCRKWSRIGLEWHKEIQEPVKVQFD